MTQIANCACCGGEARIVSVLGGFIRCANGECRVSGPNNDPDGAKWNALMRPSAAVAADAPDELAAANALIETLRAQCKTQLDAVPGIVASARADALAEGAAERDALRAEVERLQSALRELVYEVTHLSPESEDGSHLSFISGDALRKARAALAQKEG